MTRKKLAIKKKRLTKEEGHGRPAAEECRRERKHQLTHAGLFLLLFHALLLRDQTGEGEMQI